MTYSIYTLWDLTEPAHEWHGWGMIIENILLEWTSLSFINGELMCWLDAEAPLVVNSNVADPIQFVDIKIHSVSYKINLWYGACIQNLATRSCSLTAGCWWRCRRSLKLWWPRQRRPDWRVAHWVAAVSSALAQSWVALMDWQEHAAVARIPLRHRAFFVLVTKCQLALTGIPATLVQAAQHSIVGWTEMVRFFLPYPQKPTTSVTCNCLIRYYKINFR
jgi:hypothetical protein